MKRTSSILICCGAAVTCWALVALFGPSGADHSRGEDLQVQPSSVQVTPAVTPLVDTPTGEPSGTPENLEIVNFTPGTDPKAGAASGVAPSPVPSQEQGPSRETQPSRDTKPGREPGEAGMVAGSDYDFSQPVPETEPVEEEYFADAAFIGDSRTDGFRIFSGLTQGDYLYKTGLTVFQIDKERIKVEGKKMTVAQALERKEYGKIYVCLGLNELGQEDDQGYYDHYAALIDLIRATRPEATVYVQLLIPVNEQKRAESGVGDYINNAQIQVYNDLLYQLAQEKHVFLVDPAQAIVDETGQPAYEEVADGVHFRKEPYQRWLDYLKRHTVSKGEWE